MFRIHGTIQNDTIGHATSAGCIRLFNQDAIELYERVNLGTVSYTHLDVYKRQVESRARSELW